MTVVEKETKLADKIKENRLRFTDQNLQKVQMAYCTAIKWNDLFTGAMLGSLPDPDNIEGHEELFREWLVQAYVTHGRDERKVRAALEKVRLGVLKEDNG